MILGTVMDTEPGRLHTVAGVEAPLLDPEDGDPSADDLDGDASLAVKRRITVSALLNGRGAGFDRSARRGLIHRRSGPVDVRPADDEAPARPVVPSRRARRIAALLGQRPAWEHVPATAPLLEVFRRQHPDADSEMEWLRRSYQVAQFLHGNQQRRSGAPYVSHPLAVATVLAELGMDVSTLVAALLHDTVEDTDYTLAECRVDFGAEVARLVDGVTKLDGARLGKDVAERETYRKMVLAAGADLRVLLIKLVDRLH